MEDIGREVRRLREERSWSQAKLAAAADMAVSGISQIETGVRSPSAATLRKLARAFGLEVADLFPKAEAPLPFEDPDEEALAARRVRAFLDRAPSEEERVYELDKATEILRGYADRWRMEIDDIEAEGTYPYGRGIEMRVMWERLSDSLRNDGTLDYAGRLEMGRVEASTKERDAGDRLTDTLLDMFNTIVRARQVEHDNREKSGKEIGELERLEAVFAPGTVRGKHSDEPGFD